MCAPSRSCERSAFLSADFEQLHKHIYASESPSLQVSSNTAIQVLRESKRQKEKTQCNSVLDPDFGLKGEAFQYSFCLSFMLITAHC